MTDPFPHIRWVDTILHGCVPRTLSGQFVESLSAAVLAGNMTCEESAWWYDAPLAEVEESVRFARCWWARRGAYERAFSGRGAA